MKMGMKKMKLKMGMRMIKMEMGMKKIEDGVPGRCEGEVDGTEEKIRNGQTGFYMFLF